MVECNQPKNVCSISLIGHISYLWKYFFTKQNMFMTFRPNERSNKKKTIKYSHISHDCEIAKWRRKKKRRNVKKNSIIGLNECEHAPATSNSSNSSTLFSKLYKKSNASNSSCPYFKSFVHTFIRIGYDRKFCEWHVSRTSRIINAHIHAWQACSFNWLNRSRVVSIINQNGQLKSSI